MTSYTEHFLITEKESLRDYFLREISSCTTDWQRSIELGAIYLNKKRVLDSSALLQKGDYLRFHSKPKRYSKEFDIAKNIVMETSSFIAVNKPANLPSIPTLDNYKENLLQIFRDHYQTPVYPCNRLDIPTSGLIILAKNKDFQKNFNRMLQTRRVNKIYQAKSNIGLHAGLYEHHMEKTQFSPKKIHTQPKSNTYNCRMEILRVTKHVEHYEHWVRLITGRPHQVRAQMAFLGAPILGDELYGSENSGSLALSSYAISFIYEGQNYQICLNKDCHQIKKYL